MAYARRKDGNHGEIMRAFERMGCEVFDAYQVGRGFPDLVVQYGRVTYLVEIKTKRGKLTDTQDQFPLVMHVARTVGDVEVIVRKMRRENFSLDAAA